MRTSSRTTVIGAATGLVLAATATTIVAAALAPDGSHLRGEWTTGGEAWLELEDRNVLPTICFVWESHLPQDGDAIESRILSRDGDDVVSLGIGDQWVEGAASGCEVMDEEDFRAVFADPDGYVVEFEVVENQGTPTTPPVRSGPLEAHDDSDGSAG